MLTSTKTPTPQTCARAQRPPVPGRSPRTGEGRFPNNALRVFHNVAAHRRGNNAYSAITTRRGQCSEYPLQRDVPLRNIRCNVCTNKRCSASASRVCFCEFRCQVACGLAVKFFLLTKTHTSTRSSREHVNCSFAACYFFPVRLFGGHSTRSFRAANSCPKLRIGRIFPEGVLNFLPFVLAISAEKKNPPQKRDGQRKPQRVSPDNPRPANEKTTRETAHTYKRPKSKTTSIAVPLRKPLASMFEFSSRVCNASLRLNRFKVKCRRRLIHGCRCRDFPESPAVFIPDEYVVLLHVCIQVRNIRLVNVRFRFLDVKRSGIPIDEHRFDFELTPA